MAKVALSQELLQRGCQVVWCVPKSTEEENKGVSGLQIPPGIEVRKIDDDWRMRAYPSPKGLADFTDRLIKEDPDAIVVNGHNAAFLYPLMGAIVACGKSKRMTRVFHSELGSKLRGGSKSEKARQLIQKAGEFIGKIATKLGARTIAVSEAVASQIRKSQIDSQPIVCYPPTRADKCEANKNEIKQGGLKVLMVGRVASEKRVQVFVETAKRAKEINPEISFSLIGPITDNKIQNYLETEAAGIVEAKGSKTGEELCGEYLNSDILLFPSLKEGFGLVAAEALAHGEVVIGSSPAVAEILGKSEGDKPGFIVNTGADVGDAEKMAEIILKLDRDRELLRTLALAAVALGKQFEGKKLGERFANAVLGKI